MSRKELLDIVEKLEKRLREQMKIVKERDDRIARLEEKLQSQTQQNCQIRKLAHKIGRLCDPAGRNRETLLGELTSHTKRCPIVKRTASRPIFLASDILDHAPVNMNLSNSDDDSLYHYRHHQERETTAGGHVELSKNHQEKPIRRDSEFYSTSGYIDRERKQKKKKNNLGVLDVKHSRKSQERIVTSQNRQENPQQSASPHSRFDANPRKLGQSPKIDQVKTENTQFKRRKRRKAKRKPPKFSPCTSQNEELIPPKEDHARGSSAELILVPCSTRMSASVSPQVSPVPQEEFRSKMSEMSGADSASSCSEGKGEQPNLFPRLISDRSLTSLARGLPSIPSQHSADDLSIFSLVHLGNLHKDLSKEKELTDWGEEGVFNLLI